MIASKAYLSFLNTEMSLVRRAVLQNKMALDIMTDSQGGTWAFVHTKCYTFIFNESANILSLLNHVIT